MYTATSWSHSAAMDGCRAARFKLGVAWIFPCKMHEIEKSSKFKSTDYGSQSAENRNSATAVVWFKRCRPALNPPKGVSFARINPLDPVDQMLSQKRLTDIGVNTFAGENWLRMA